MTHGGSTQAVRGEEFLVPRERMLKRLERSGVDDPRVLAALRAVPRHRLVPEGLREHAYRNSALPIGDGQTISAPDIVGHMSQALELQGDETVLEIGTGSAYQAAILSRLAERVISIERVPRLAARARSGLDAMGVANVIVHLGDGTCGHPANAPYQAILVTAGGPEVPTPLLSQLDVGGRLVGPFGDRQRQELLRVRRHSADEYETEHLGACRFVDLRGSHGWK
jgi:protein-L-isoaspartate(D-aspartate) O-methyltransferase